MTNLDPHLLDRMVMEIQDHLDESAIYDLLDDAFAEMFDLQERETIGSEGMMTIQSRWLGMALLRVAENQFMNFGENR